MRLAHWPYLLPLGLGFSFLLTAAQVQRYRLGPAAQVNLGPINDSVRDLPPARPGLLRVAAHVSLSSNEMARGLWQKTSNGANVWRLDLRSPNAIGLRLHFTQFAAGAGQVWVHDAANPPARVFGPYSGNGLNGDGDFWTEIIFADTVEIEYQPAAGGPTVGPPPFQISELSHLWQFGRLIAPRQPASTAPEAQAPTAAATPMPTNFRCFLDASCYADPNSGTYVPAVANAVRGTAFIVFGDSSGTYQCTGTLLNAPNASPLLLTAGHCINTQAQAHSLVTIFNAVDQSCTQPPFTVATNAQLNQLPQASGVRVLSFSDQAFIDESSQSEINNDLDYSLVLLNAFPAWSNVLLSGYNAGPLARRQQLVSVSAPQGFFLKAAFSTVLPSLWDNGFDVDQTTEGRIDAGLSGSGIFDSAGNLVGLLSTGSSPCSDPAKCPTLDSCDVNGEFIATYTSFSAIYPSISSYLNQPLDASGVALPANPSVSRHRHRQREQRRSGRHRSHFQRGRRGERRRNPRRHAGWAAALSGQRHRIGLGTRLGIRGERFSIYRTFRESIPDPGEHHCYSYCPPKRGCLHRDSAIHPVSQFIGLRFHDSELECSRSEGNGG